MKNYGTSQFTAANEINSYLSDTGAADAYAVALSPAIAAYTPGLKIRVKIANTNTGASTIAVNGLATKNIYKNVTTPLDAGDLPANMIVELVYDGTNFQFIKFGGGGGGTDTNIYITDGTLTANRTMTLSTFDLNIKKGSNSVFTIKNTGERVCVGPINSTAIGRFEVNSSGGNDWRGTPVALHINQANNGNYWTLYTNTAAEAISGIDFVGTIHYLGNDGDFWTEAKYSRFGVDESSEIGLNPKFKLITINPAVNGGSSGVVSIWQTVTFDDYPSTRNDGTSTTNRFLSTDSTGVIKMLAVDSSGFGSTAITADNGLTMSSSTNVQWGGTLIKHTTITGNGFSTTINSSIIGNTLLVTNAAVSASATCITASSTYGIGISATGSLPFWASQPNGGTNDVTRAALFTKQQSAASSNGVGVSLEFGLKNSAGSSNTRGSIIHRLSTATASSETSEFAFGVINVGSSITEVFTIKGTGQLRGNLYGLGTFTGTAAYNLAVDSSGNIIEVAAGGGGSVTADNGLTMSTSTNVQLGSTTNSGSPLLHATYINTSGANVLNVEGARTGFVAIFNVTNTSSGIGAYVESRGASNPAFMAYNTNSANVISAYSDSEGQAFYGNITGAATSTAITGLQLFRRTSGTAAAGLGVSILLAIQNAGGSSVAATTLTSSLTAATAGAEYSQLDVYGINNTNQNQIAAFYGSGVVGIGKFSSYTATRLEIADNSLAGASMVKITTTSTAATGSAHRGLEIAMSGTNVNANQATYGIYSSNSHVSGGGASHAYGIYGAGTDTGVYGSGTNGVWGDGTTGVKGTSTSTAVWAIATSSGVGIQTNSIDNISFAGIRTPASTNTVETIAQFERGSTGTANTGIGGALDFYIKGSAGGTVPAAKLTWKYTNATTASRTSQVFVNAYDSGSEYTILTLNGTGAILFDRNLGNYANDAAAATGGVAINQLYRNGSVVMIRVS